MVGEIVGGSAAILALVGVVVFGRHTLLRALMIPFRGQLDRAMERFRIFEITEIIQSDQPDPLDSIVLYLSSDFLARLEDDGEGEWTQAEPGIFTRQRFDGTESIVTVPSELRKKWHTYLRSPSPSQAARNISLDWFKRQSEIAGSRKINRRPTVSTAGMADDPDVPPAVGDISASLADLFRLLGPPPHGRSSQAGTFLADGPGGTRS
ncbi:hypothetical protein [Embleya sp. NBC_00896]|uniref:hypothetical protein n=1 Tax=Embleya sp. NBC_00896 TaxID=2975961 RepID=UPI00386808CB|nr:hypothetical protein OG928_32235 [Embleya sp. NBC_00896]